MLKYIAFMTVDPLGRTMGKWICGPTAQLFTSPIEKDKAKVEQWLQEELKKYPDACVDDKYKGQEYCIRTSIIAFNVEKSSKNAGYFLTESLHFIL